jgi:hypothetical protein
MIVVLKNRKNKTKTMSSLVQNIPFTKKGRQLRRNMIHGELKKVIDGVIFPFGQENIPKPYLKSKRLISLTRSACELCG